MYNFKFIHFFSCPQFKYNKAKLPYEMLISTKRDIIVRLYYGSTHASDIVHFYNKLSHQLKS